MVIQSIQNLLIELLIRVFGMNHSCSSGRNILEEYSSEEPENTYEIEIEASEQVNNWLARKAQRTNTKKEEIASRILEETIRGEQE